MGYTQNGSPPHEFNGSTTIKYAVETRLEYVLTRVLPDLLMAQCCASCAGASPQAQHEEPNVNPPRPLRVGSHNESHSNIDRKTEIIMVADVFTFV